MNKYVAIPYNDVNKPNIGSQFNDLDLTIGCTILTYLNISFYF